MRRKYSNLGSPSSGRDVHAKVRSLEVQTSHLRLPGRGTREAARDSRLRRHESWVMGEKSWAQAWGVITNL